MFSIRVTGPDGKSRTYPFPGTQCSIGREAANDIVLDGSAVSSQHCMLELSGTGCTLKERGSTNGTWLNNQRIDEPTVITESDRVYVGSYLLELSRMAPAAERRDHEVNAPQLRGPILRTPGPDRQWREQHARLTRYAEAWDTAERPAHLALSDEELRRAKRWLRQARDDLHPPVTALQREFLDASNKAAGGKLIKRLVLAVAALLVLGAGITAGVLTWPWFETEEPEPEPEATSESEGDSDGDEEDDGDDDGTVVANSSAGATPEDDEDKIIDDVNAPIKHIVVPLETLQDVANRYGASAAAIADSNFINPDDPNLVGKELTIKNPAKRPLPQQKVEITISAGETWRRLSERFGVPATKLQAYNEGGELKPGAKLSVWIDPKPYKPRKDRKPIPQFFIDKRSLSVGTPQNGSLVGGAQLPESPLYTRRSPHLMYGSSYTIANLQTAIANWRQDVDYDGALMLSDISKRSGGLNPPHKSHQSGRDIDIWLPTLRGVYNQKEKGSGKLVPKRPLYDEVDWYALWGLVRALIKTGAVKYVFLDWRYQKFVYDAARNMGATQEELDAWIQYPRSKRSSRAIFRHSVDHLSHIHVRFKCGDWEKGCSRKSFGAGD